MEVHGRQAHSSPAEARGRGRRATERLAAGETSGSDPLGRTETDPGPETPVLEHARRNHDRPRDVVEISSAGPRGTDPERQARVAELREALAAGELVTPARLGRAAEALLGASTDGLA